ncbi:hypothetical protein QP411_05995 [Pseudoglutamicibacter cumminsii]|uniref:hypothetical protein n=1 Tax=Pseudoglutamicibacter cumminsii TaxID=156979 RepID=UPI0025547327|nr:hypothetical protein [Pseudoglutamicibacter cumminsii]MDK7083465.1 hypothetical protein [Pseudoglutamicibacter cumminsii]
MNTQPVANTFSRVMLTFGPAFWFGLIVAISLIEAPLKFQAPGITIPLGLGIGRLVFTAMNVVEVVLAIMLLVAAFRAGVATKMRNVLVGLVAVLAIKVALIRPFLNKRTDAVLAGVDDGGSSWHYFYIAADGLLLVGLVIFMVLVAKQWLKRESLEKHSPTS